MGRFLVALALTAGFAVYAPALASAAEDTRWQIEPCAEGTRALWVPRADRAGTDLSCTTEEALAAAVSEAATRGLTGLANVAIAGAQQASDQSLTPESPCVLGARGAIGNDIGTCVAA